MPSSTHRTVESTTATMKRGLWTPPDELDDDPDTCDWALDDTLAPSEDEPLPVPRPARRPRAVWLVAGGLCVGAPLVLLGGLLVAVAAGGAVAYAVLSDAPPARITTLP